MRYGMVQCLDVQEAIKRLQQRVIAKAATIDKGKGRLRSGLARLGAILMLRAFRMVRNYDAIQYTRKWQRLTMPTTPRAAALSVLDRARLALLHGRSLDALDEYSAEAEELLSQAVKLDPASVRGWNALGHCFWKKRDLRSAVACFEDGVKRCANVEGLRHLSMVLRQVPGTPGQVAANVRDSVERAKAAVALDLADGESWYVLGNAQLSHFFAVQRDFAGLDRAKKAYARARALQEAAQPAAAPGAAAPAGGKAKTRRNPDLYYNCGQALQFLEEYDDAVAAYRTAHDIDPALDAKVRDWAMVCGGADPGRRA
jgi:tetratricopeptide (TPR) repeat protein